MGLRARLLLAVGPRAAQALLVACLIVAPLAGCAVDNPSYCNSDEECRDPGRAEYDVARPHCHGEGHFCYEGCARDADCRDETRPWYTPSRPICNLATRDCVGSGADGGGPDLPMNLELGASCQQAAQCKSGFCASGVCCNEACSALCKSCQVPGYKGTCTLVPSGADPDKECAGKDALCAGTCNGQGGCTWASTSVSCKSPTCSGETLTTHHCDGAGTCAGKAGTCGGFLCDAGGAACRSTCASNSECSATFECAAGKCVKDQPKGAPCGTSPPNPAACAAGLFCTDGVCCAVSDCGDCKECGGASGASPGECEAVKAGPAPSGDCSGDAACGAGQCDGAGACAYKAKDAECGWSCSGNAETISKCDGSYKCVAPSTGTACAPYVCNGATRCHTSCKGLSECMSLGVCDRTGAHVSGGGACVSASQVEWVGSGQEVADVLAAMGSGKTHLGVPGGTYNKAVTVGKNVTIVGTGTSASPSKIDPSADGPAVTVQAGAKVGLQGLVVQGATGTAGDGMYCVGTSTSKATLTIVETVVKGNEGYGVNTSYCDITLRRDKVQNNQGGGAYLAQGKLVVTENLVTSNGTVATATVGGLKLLPIAASGNVFVNNTVAYNGGSHLPSGGGVTCSPSVDLVSSIIYFNGASPVSSCAPKYSDVEYGSTASNNIALDPKFTSVVGGDFTPQSPASPCIDAGTDTVTGVTLSAIDLAGNPRSVDKVAGGSKVDMGCYEVQ